eukprot:Nk52_evm104s914 gene=Nk52_evmTU104s914
MTVPTSTMDERKQKLAALAAKRKQDEVTKENGKSALNTSKKESKSHSSGSSHKRPHASSSSSSSKHKKRQQSESEDDSEESSSESDSDNSEKDASPSPKRSKGKGKMPMKKKRKGNDSDSGGSDVEASDISEDELQGLDTANIITTGRRTRGVKIQYDFSQFGDADDSDDD